MPVDHLAIDTVPHLPGREELPLLRQRDEEDDVPQRVAQLLAEVGVVPLQDGLPDLPGLVDRVVLERTDRLLEVPGAAARGMPQPPGQPQEPIHGAGT
jgi:hypothetical protein